MQRTMKTFSLVFLDRSGANNNLTHRYGQVQGKDRVKDSTPLKTPKTTAIVSSVRLNCTTVPDVVLPLCLVPETIILTNTLGLTLLIQVTAIY